MTTLGGKSKKEGTDVNIKLIHFVVQQKVTALESDYAPVKIN